MQRQPQMSGVLTSRPVQTYRDVGSGTDGAGLHLVLSGGARS